MDTGGGDGDAEVDLHEMGDDRGQERHQEELLRRRPAVRFGAARPHRRQGNIDDQSQDEACRQAHTGHPQAPVDQERQEHAAGSAGDPQQDEEPALRPAAHQPEPPQPDVEDAAE